MSEPQTTAEDVDFEEMYQGKSPLGTRIPWDTKEPQPGVIALEASGQFAGEVADLGCGPGDNAIFLASRGHRVTGLDGAPSAIEQARARASAKGVEVGFAVADATKLDGYEDRFDTVLDSALYHCFTEEVRHTYVEALTRATKPGARLHMFCFTDAIPAGVPVPFLISERNLRETVGRSWEITRLEQASYRTAFTLDMLHEASRAVLGTDADPATIAALDIDERGNLVLPVWQLTARRP
ncbi:class I SAM-dependent methyltransferase [Amycolatopsis sp. OK19-0408]|uniref:Class I SAM-dependent methyltransferase n=1 Tax=Amycolatopsis iheyensis TaxID=2945988 RepID=A0A9X2SN13_9PSEU|nr:class I SAM-dependent methyltransferase [Amycolatopsis iheyensis]MCR6488422.1 class I SAM-dependent methyltransferase [Amycolatopsis iheyensis]